MSGHILELSENVARKRVVYKNRYGLDIVGELYHTKDLDWNKKHAALIVGAPYGGVKEQGPCVYGNELAKMGFIVLTFDQSFMGESGGFPRNVSSPDIFVENFSAAVDFLGLKSFVDREKIGVVGICGSGGFALSAAQCDTRIKAVATLSMYDMSFAGRGFMDKEALQATKEHLSQQRWIDAENGYPEYNPFFPEQPIDAVPADLPEPAAEWFRFYALKRGHHIHDAFYDVIAPGGCLIDTSSMSAYMVPMFLMPRGAFKYSQADRDTFMKKMMARVNIFPAKVRSGVSYGISKYFVVWYAKAEAARFGTKNVRIVSITPGNFETPMGELEKDEARTFLKYNAIKRLGKPDEIAALYAACADPAMGYLTGADIVCDGGCIAGGAGAWSK